MASPTRTAAALVTLAMVAACREAPPPAASSGAPPPPPPAAAVTRAPSLDELAEATYTGLRPGDPITLSGGAWDGPPPTHGAKSRPRVELLRGLHAAGDLTGDGAEEAVGVIAAGGGGSGTTVALVVVGRNGDRLVHLATATLGDRVQVKAARVEGGRLVAEVVRHGKADPRCCPAERARLTWRIADHRLALQGDETTGRLSLDDLAGPEWVLTHWGPDEPLAGEVRPTLTASAGRFAGNAGCNHYTASVGPPAPGGFAVSRIVVTRTACPPPGDGVEQRFLALLPKLHGIQFLGGDLLLTHDDGVLRFTARTAPVRRTGAAGPAPALATPQP